LKKKGTWNARRVAITAIFVLTILCGAKELLFSGSSSDSGPSMKAKPVKAATMTVKAPDGVVEEKVVVRSPEPCREAVTEADRWRSKDWDGVDLFSGKSWAYSEEVALPVYTAAKGDTIVQATSYSSDGWRAVVGGKALRVGDALLGGKVVSISEGRVVVRGPGWEKVLRFSKT